MGRPREGGTPVQPGNKVRLGHVLDIENDEAAMPVADVEPIAHPHRMMTAMRRAFPGRLLATGGPLARHPPPADLFRTVRPLEINDRDDVAEIRVELGRAVHIPAVECEAMHSA